MACVSEGGSRILERDLNCVPQFLAKLELGVQVMSIFDRIMISPICAQKK